MTKDAHGLDASGGAGKGSECWHALRVEEALERAQADAPRGLSAQEASRRLARFGPNALPEGALNLVTEGVVTINLGLLVGNLLQLMVVFIPFMNEIFHAREQTST